jgi:hypothetical protein
VEAGEVSLARAGNWAVWHLRAEMLIAQKEWVRAEHYLGMAIDTACRQSARAFELASATCLARLWCGQGQGQKAHDLLAPILGAVSEEADTPDIGEAKTLLDGLKLT